MIALDKTLLENTFLLREARGLKTMGFISEEQFASVSSGVPVLKSHNSFLIRFGFFFLGNFLFSSIIGVISMIAIPFAATNYEFTFYVYAVIGFMASEFFARGNHYRFGLDDAFALAAQLSLVGAIFSTSKSPLLVCAAMATVGLVCCLRYVNTLAALISVIGVTAFVADLILDYKLIDLSFLPFVMFLLAVGIYFFCNKISKSLKVYYVNALHIVYGFSLVLGYFSVNYLVVRELSVQKMEFVITDNNDIPFAFLFYGLTFIIPVFYIVYSLFIKNKTMLNIGFLTLAFSFFTIRYYYQLIPLENALILGGILLFTLSYFFIRKLKDKAFGVTFKKERGANTDSMLSAEAIIINSQLDLNRKQIEEPMAFGGGEFSGGGAGSSF